MQVSLTKHQLLLKRLLDARPCFGRLIGVHCRKDNDGAYADQKAPENDDSQEMSRDQLRAVIEHLTPRKMTIFSDALLSDSTFYNLECVKNARKIAVSRH